MYGLEAISNASGWQMAALGVTIVFVSLIVLAIIISQLHNLLEFWDKRSGLLQNTPVPEIDSGPHRAARLPHPPVCPEDIDLVAALWEPLVEKLGVPFSLQELYESAAKNDFPHPHLTINRLRQAGILVPVDNCLFSWNTHIEDTDSHG